MTTLRPFHLATQLTFGALFGSYLAQWGQDVALSLTSYTSLGCLLLMLLQKKRQRRQDQKDHERLDQRFMAMEQERRAEPRRPGRSHRRALARRETVAPRTR